AGCGYGDSNMRPLSWERLSRTGRPREARQAARSSLEVLDSQKNKTMRFPPQSASPQRLLSEGMARHLQSQARSKQFATASVASLAGGTRELPQITEAVAIRLTTHLRSLARCAQLRWGCALRSECRFSRNSGGCSPGWYAEAAIPSRALEWWRRATSSVA